MNSVSLNYAHPKKIIPFFDKKLGIEYFPGDKRFVGTDHERELKNCYGHIRGYVGTDKEALDCYVSPNFIEDPSNVGLIFEVHQLDGDGNFDEHKYMIGFYNELEAKDAYLSEMPEERFGGIKAVDIVHIEKNKKNYVFAETDIKKVLDEKYKSLNASQQKDFMLGMIYEIVDENYGGKIQNFVINENPTKGYVISGIFETPRMGGKKLIMGFDINETKIVLTPLNPEVLNYSEKELYYVSGNKLINVFAEKVNYFPVEYFDFAQKQMNCVIGWSCKGPKGYACLSRSKKNCNNNLNPLHRTYVGWLKDQLLAEAKLHQVHLDEAKILKLKKPPGFSNSKPVPGSAVPKQQPSPQTAPTPTAKKSDDTPAITPDTAPKSPAPTSATTTTKNDDDKILNNKIENEGILKKLVDWGHSIGLITLDKTDAYNFVKDFLNNKKTDTEKKDSDHKTVSSVKEKMFDDFIQLLEKGKEQIDKAQKEVVKKFVNFLVDKDPLWSNWAKNVSSQTQPTTTKDNDTPAKAPDTAPQPTTTKDNDTPAKAPDTAPQITAKKSQEGFPKNLTDLVVVKKLGGTTGAQLVKDPATGKQYVMKKGTTSDHLESESAADSAYQALGINVPKHQVYKDADDKPVKLSEYIEGKDLAEIMKNGTQQEKDLIKSEIKKHFAADSLLGNWDVVGLEKDNIMLGNDGKAYRIDNGGSLGHRAQGAKKDPKFWNKYPMDLWSMRDPKINPVAAEYFSGLTHKEIVAQINDLVSKKDKLNGIFSKEDQEIINGRIDEMKRVADISKALDEDKWNDDYISNFTKHTVGIRASGITDKLPDSLAQKSNDSDNYGFTKMIDKNGKEFDDLRGKNSIVKDLDDYMKNSGGNYYIISDWMGGQAGYSWSSASQAVKYFMSNQRNVPKDSFWWGPKNTSNPPHQNSENDYNIAVTAHGKEKFGDTLTMYHAFTYELLSKTDIPNKNKDGTLDLIRTEDKNVTDSYGLKPGDTGYIKRGSLESTSIVKDIYVGTTEMTTQKVPIHRVFATYLTERSPGSGQTPFFGDNENEFLAMLEGIESKHVKSKKLGSA